MDSIEFNELFNLLQNGDETDRIEAKSAVHGIGKSFLETVSAYAMSQDLGVVTYCLESRKMAKHEILNTQLQEYLIQTNFKMRSPRNVDNVLAFPFDLLSRLYLIHKAACCWFILQKLMLMKNQFTLKAKVLKRELIDA